MVNWMILSLVLSLVLVSGCQKEIRYIEEKDACGVIGGNVMHTIEDEDTCNIKCLASCESRKAKLLSINFTATSQCNVCGCYCEIQE